MINVVDLANTTTSMETTMKVNGRTMSVMAEEHISMLLLAQSTQECGILANGRDMENSSMLTTNMLVCLKKIG